MPGSQEELGFRQPLLSAVCILRQTGIQIQSLCSCNRFQITPVSSEPPLPQEEGISVACMWHSQSNKLKETPASASDPLVLVSRRGPCCHRPRRWAYPTPLPSLETQRWKGSMHSDGLLDLLASSSLRNRSFGGTDECRVKTLCYG